jgi:hypothetical protein
MKKFLILAHGDMKPSPQFQQAHQAWWSSMAGHVVDSGNPLSNGHNVTRAGQAIPVAESQAPVLGYSIIEAETLEDAVDLLSECPMDMWLYEAMPM